MTGATYREMKSLAEVRTSESWIAAEKHNTNTYENTDQMDTAANQYYMSTVCCYWLYLARSETTQLAWTGLHMEIHCSAQQIHATPSYLRHSAL